jgi:hypothetical protein
MKATNIIWEINYLDIYNKQKSLKPIESARLLNISVISYNAMSEGEKLRLIANQYGTYNTMELCEFFKLPKEIEIPDTVENINEYLEQIGQRKVHRFTMEYTKDEIKDEIEYDR